MNEPWLAKQDDKRPEPSIYTFIIFCEDEVSEPEYFKSFEKDYLSVVVFKGQRKKKFSVDKAITYCRTNGLLEFKGIDVTPMFGDGVQVWCVFDRDKSSKTEIDENEDTSFFSSIELAKKYFLNVAWSNDAFELWPLLHFEEVDPNNPEYTHRDKYFGQLLGHFKVAPNITVEFKKRLDDVRFTYENVKQPKNFIPNVLPLLKPNTTIAIERAKKLEVFHADKNYHEKSPCTTVHHLVLQLIEKGAE